MVASMGEMTCYDDALLAKAPCLDMEAVEVSGFLLKHAEDGWFPGGIRLE